MFDLAGDVISGNAGAFGGQRERDRPALAVRRPGNKRHFAFKFPRHRQSFAVADSALR